MWWTSLLRNLADSVAPEKLPPLELTSEPANAIVPSDALLLAAWSNVISTPKVFLPDQAKPVLTAASPGVVSLFFRNEHYPDEETYLYAIADAPTLASSRAAASNSAAEVAQISGHRDARKARVRPMRSRSIRC